MQNIIGFIKKEMAEQGITYDQLAANIGTTRQNLWLRLNKGNAPTFESVKKILEGLGYKLELKRKNEPDPRDEETAEKDFFECAEEEQVTYECIEKMLAAVGYVLEINTQ